MIESLTLQVKKSLQNYWVSEHYCNLRPLFLADGEMVCSEQGRGRKISARGIVILLSLSSDVPLPAPCHLCLLTAVQPGEPTPKTSASFAAKSRSKPRKPRSMAASVSFQDQGSSVKRRESVAKGSKTSTLRCEGRPCLRLGPYKNMRGPLSSQLLLSGIT